jgi:RNA polymerase sigma factor (sigma-70 family)
MATNPLIVFLQDFRRSALPQENAEQTDAQLLEAVVRRRDSQALEGLVRRHAPMVWGVCRRTLANHHDAEDAFQATFLVLVRRAASIRSRDLLVNWLYRVAYKTAGKARQLAAKRSAREKPVVTMPEPTMDPHECEFGPEIRALLDEELSRLPDKYRIAVLLCDLEGRSRPEAAQQLRLPEGTVASRQARGRAMLAKRLRRRGVGVSAAALAAALPQQAASGSVPASMLVTTIKVATLLAAGEVTAAGATSALVFTLTEGVLKTMALVRIKAAGVMLLIAALVLCGGMVTYHALADQPAKTERPPGKLKKPNANDDITRAMPASGGRAAEIKNVREVANLRSAELLQKAQNTHAILSRVMKNKVAWDSRYIDITDLYNGLNDLWVKLAGYGLGRDPYLDTIRLDDTGSSRAKPPPDFGIPGPYIGMGLPRLHERFLEQSGAKGEVAQKMTANFKKLVHAYSNPEVYSHRAFSQRAYAKYRRGKGLFTDQYLADLRAVDHWLTDLETILGKVPEYFEKAP